MNQLCILTNLSSSEWASWVQAFGSIVAIVFAAGIAIWQSREQYRNSLALLREEERVVRTELTKALSIISNNCARAIRHYASKFANREDVHKIADQEIHFDFSELRTLENAVVIIPLHSLPHELVSLTMMLSSTMRQFREKIETALRFHQQMNAEAFKDFFCVLVEMQSSLEHTCKDIEEKVLRLQNEAVNMRRM